MASNRELNAVNEIDCPKCGAKKGTPCTFARYQPGFHGPACHRERRDANQERRRAEINAERNSPQIV